MEACCKTEANICMSQRNIFDGTGRRKRTDKYHRTKLLRVHIAVRYVMLSKGCSLQLSFLEHIFLSFSLFALWFKALDVLACTLFQPTRYCGAAGSGADTSPFEPLFQRYVQNVSRPIQCFTATCPLWLPRAQSGNNPTVLTVLIQQAILNPIAYSPMG